MQDFMRNWIDKALPDLPPNVRDIVFYGLAVVLIICICLLIKWNRRTKKERANQASRINDLGYNRICSTSNVKGFTAGTIWEKDGNFYFEKFSGGGGPENATPIEIKGVSEITKNSKLVALEIRYRINGEVKSTRVGSLGHNLLTIEEQLGY